MLLVGLASIVFGNFINCSNDCGPALELYRARDNLAYFIIAKPQAPATHEYFVQIDTGSSNFGIKADGGQGLSYPPTNCATTNRKVHVLYGDKSSWTGDICITDVTFPVQYADQGGPADITLHDLELVRITTSNDFFSTPDPSAFKDAPGSKVGCQGIIGLAYPSLAQEQQTLPMDSSDLPSSVFTLMLCGHSDEPTPSLGGKFIMGGIHQQKASGSNLGKQLYSGEMLWTPVRTGVARKGYYAVIVTEIAFEGYLLVDYADALSQQTTGQNLFYIADSGSTDLQLPTSVFIKVVEHLQWLNTATFCHPVTPAILDKAPVLHIDLAHADNPTQSIRIEILVKDYTRPCKLTEKTLGVSLGITESDGNLFVLGDVLLEGYTVAFDKQENRVGFGAASGCNNTATRDSVTHRHLASGQNWCTDFSQDNCTEDHSRVLEIVLIAVGAALLLALLLALLWSIWPARRAERAQQEAVVHGSVRPFALRAGARQWAYL